MKFHKILWETPESCKFAATLKKCRPCTAVKYRVSSIRAKRIGDEEHANARKNRISKGTLAQSICRCPAGAVVCTRCAVCHRARLDEAVEGPAIWAPWVINKQTFYTILHRASCGSCGTAAELFPRGSEEPFPAEGGMSRQDMAVMLFRCSEKLNLDTSARGGLAAYSDASEVSEYAQDAMGWAVGAGLLPGEPNRPGLHPVPLERHHTGAGGHSAAAVVDLGRAAGHHGAGRRHALMLWILAAGSLVSPKPIPAMYPAPISNSTPGPPSRWACCKHQNLQHAQSHEARRHNELRLSSTHSHVPTERGWEDPTTTDAVMSPAIAPGTGSRLRGPVLFN